ncbi:methyl-CpG-binding domain-containing protein 9-like isoform X2 [Cynara cardunculus var. scolymus]|uniref:methyl-CpG-binding domain-containing protein 9-like isoform X2 n=1 Tax=Cynara cardunculus var. scolymus TaxID=59895 RepID=UPI000D628719|nr:methyl-CpG-binding domain-containing protein 9-like isoform X2 [Cynara cardunculus var. scolymus]
MRIARLNLDIATQNANLVYLQALKNYISERRGVLGDGWVVKFEFSESICKRAPIYYAPDGSRFNSMPEVAHHFGLLLPPNSFETNDKGGSFALLQNGSHATKSLDSASRSLNANIIRERKSMSQSGVSNGGTAIEVDPMGNSNRGSELFLDGFPVQFQDFFVTSLGKIDPRVSFHTASQIWPIGYKSIWHDNATGSIFVCNVLDAGDCGPIFRVNRHPCTKHSIPNASTVLCRPKSRPSDGKDTAGSHDSAVNRAFQAFLDERINTRDKLAEQQKPPSLDDGSYSCLDKVASCLTTESAFPLQCIPSNNVIRGDIIGEFMVEGRSPSSAWQMVLETLLSACHQAFKDLSVLTFCCNHTVDRQHIDDSYNINSLDKFGYLRGPKIVNLIRTVEQLDGCCMVLRRWLQPDRFGLDAEFVQELVEQLPGVSACLGYKSLVARCQNSPHTVGSGFFTVLRKYSSQPTVSDSLVENRKRLSPPGNIIASNLPPRLIGDILQAHEFYLRFHKVLGLEALPSREKLEYELLNPWDDDLKPPNSHEEESEGDGSRSEVAIKCTGVSLANFHMALVKVLVEDMLAKLTICEQSGAAESKSRKGRKKNMEIMVSSKKIKLSMFPVNEITWPEIARRCILAVLSMDGSLEASDVTNREFSEVFHCLKGDGGPLCGSLTGMAAMEADAMVLAEASEKIFSSVNSKFVNFIIDKNDLNIRDSATETNRTDNGCPKWIEVLEPVRKLPTNVGAKLRKCVYESLKQQPPPWAVEMLVNSISKDVYKGNASGPTKKIVVSVLEHVRELNPLTKKKAKESRVVRTLYDVIMRRCRMVLRSVAAEDENRAFFILMAESLFKRNESCDGGHPAPVSRPLDFRTIDLRLDAGCYGGSHESFIEDVREVWRNLRIIYRNKPKYIDFIETLSKKLEELYEQEVLTLVRKTVDYGNDSISDETKRELNTMLADTITSTLSVAPWEDGICKVCGKDENDHILLLCDRCDAEYHTYCLDPPLQRVPKASWYCPSCISFITNQAMSSQEEESDTPVLFRDPDKKKTCKEIVRNGLESLAELADAMESMEYWELGLEERVFLLKFLCDEALSSTIIRDHINAVDCNIRRDFLGRDSEGRLYYILGKPERVVVSGPHSIGEVCIASESSSSRELDASERCSWICYESDAEIEALVEWLRDDDAREKELKETIIQWQRNKSNNQNGEAGKVNRLMSSIHDTNARAALEKKFGSFSEGRVFDDGKIYRCDCLELVGSTRAHCFSCHSTFFSNEIHNDGKCGIHKEGDALVKQPTLTNDQNEPDVTFVFEEIRANFCAESLRKEVIKDVGIVGSNRNPVLVKHRVEAENIESSTPLVGRVSKILRYLKATLLDIEAALPNEAFRPSRRDSHRLRAWHVFVKSAQSIHEMVQATIILEDMIRTEHLRNEWWYWSSPSAAIKISTVSSLALRIYALDAAIFYENPPTPPADLTEPVTPSDSNSKKEASRKSNPKSSSSTMVAMSNNSEPSKTSKSGKRPKKKKLRFSAD